MYVNKKYPFPNNFLMSMRDFNHLKSSSLSDSQMSGFNYIMDNILTKTEKAVITARFKDHLSETKTADIISNLVGRPATRHDIDLILTRAMKSFVLNKNYILGGNLNISVSDDDRTLVISYSY